MTINRRTDIYFLVRAFVLPWHHRCVTIRSPAVHEGAFIKADFADIQEVHKSIVFDLQLSKKLFFFNFPHLPWLNIA